MLRTTWVAILFVGGCLLFNGRASGQDWPQWRGPNRDARASGFQAPATWPKELTKKWSKTVGNGVSTPSLADGKLIVFSREGGNEVVRCLSAATGDELWKDEYPAKAPTGGAGNFPGPRSSPTIVNGKVITLGVQGVLTCYDIASSKQLWRKEGGFDGSLPMFFPSSSPIVADGLCIAQLGGERSGGIVAYDLATGNEKWRWTGDTPAYGSPALMTVGGKNVVIAPGLKKLAALAAGDGQVLWEIPYAQGGRYNSASPIVAGDTLIIAGPGTGITALKLSLHDGALKEEKLWSNADNSVQFNTPVLKDGLLYGISNGGQLFCLNTETNKTGWATPVARPAAEGEGPARDRAAAWSGAPVRVRFAQLVQRQEEQPQRGDREGRERGEGFRRGEGRGEGRGGFGGGRGRFGGGRRGGGGGYGSVVDAGPVLLALSPAAELVVFQPKDTEYKEIARYKVADGGTYAYPVPSGNGIYIKDAEAVTLWTVE